MTKRPFSTIASPQDLLLSHLAQHYERHPEHLDVLRAIVTKKSTNTTTLPSLRTLDYFVTTTAKRFYVPLPVGDHQQDLHESYKQQLVRFSKVHFDAFQRRQRTRLHDLDTTVGQLNFFKWVMENGILEVLPDHIDSIREELATKSRITVNPSIPNSHELTSNRNEIPERCNVAPPSLL